MSGARAYPTKATASSRPNSAGKKGRARSIPGRKTIPPRISVKVQELGMLWGRAFGTEIEGAGRSFKRDCVCLLGEDLSPGPGRPRNEDVTLAIDLRAQGKPWQAIYAQCIPSSLADDSRQVAQSR